MPTTTDHLSSIVKERADDFVRYVGEGYVFDQPGRDIGIHSGLSGLLLVLIGIYEVYREQSVLELVNRGADAVVAHCRRRRSNDFSLYEGKGALVYTLLLLYGLTTDESRIRQCLELLEPIGQDYSTSEYVSDYLSNGRTGTLLVLLRLHALCGEPSPVGHLDHLLNKILGDAICTKDGLYWRRRGGGEAQPAFGFAHGTSGMFYVFARLNAILPDHGFDLICRELDIYRRRHETSSVAFPSKNLSWGTGGAGMLLSKLADEENCSLDRGEAMYKALFGDARDLSFAPEGFPLDLFDGLAGIGMSCLIAFQKTGTARFQEMAISIRECLASQCGKTCFDGGLFHGQPGILYFLLKSEQMHAGENILCPFLWQLQARGIMREWKPENLKESLLSASFGRTIALIKIRNKAPFDHFLDTAGMLNADQRGVTLGDEFDRWMDTFIRQDEGGTYKEAVLEVYALEASRVDCLDSSGMTALPAAGDRWSQRRRIVGLLGRPQSWLLEQTLVLSSSLNVVICQWDWTKGYDRTFFEDVAAGKIARSRVEILLEQGEDTNLLESNLTVDGFIFHCFDQPAQVGQVVARIRQYCRIHPSEVKAILIQFSGWDSGDDLMSRLDFLILSRIKEGLFNGQLSFCS
jgi:hypothetical protein